MDKNRITLKGKTTSTLGNNKLIISMPDMIEDNLHRLFIMNRQTGQFDELEVVLHQESKGYNLPENNGNDMRIVYWDEDEACWSYYNNPVCCVELDKQIIHIWIDNSTSVRFGIAQDK